MNTTQADLDLSKIHALLINLGYEFTYIDTDGSLLYRKDNHDIFIKNTVHTDNL